LWPLLQDDLIHGLSHITGGGLIGNTSRILAKDMALSIDWGTWFEPPIFDVIRKAGSIDEQEMRHVFNLGVGMVAIVAPDRVDDVMQRLSSQRAFVVGRVISSQ
jgi:phosphoribosylformylglycinamidine cyclo-ligase